MVLERRVVAARPVVDDHQRGHVRHGRDPEPQPGVLHVEEQADVARLGAATPQIAYTACKGAVLAMSRELAVQFAREGVRVNALCPGPVETPLLLSIFGDDPAAYERRRIHWPTGVPALPSAQAVSGLPSKALTGSYCGRWKSQLPLEEAVTAWRNVEHHRAAQKAGREGVLRDYRLRVAAAVRDYGMTERAEVPADSRDANG